MFDTSILKHRNQCQYTGIEKEIRHDFTRRLKIFQCKDTRRVRLIFCDVLNEPLSGLIIDPFNQIRSYTITGVYTLPEHRRNGMAKQMLAIARHLFGNVKHSDNLTEDGKAWRDSVEGII